MIISTVYRQYLKSLFPFIEVLQWVFALRDFLGLFHQVTKYFDVQSLEVKSLYLRILHLRTARKGIEWVSCD